MTKKKKVWKIPQGGRWEWWRLNPTPPAVLLAAAAATKSLQSWPTLCDPTDGSPPGSSIHGIFQARILEWLAISFSNAWKWKVKVKSLSHVWLFATPWTAASGATLGVTDKMEARPQPPLLVLQAWSQDERVRSVELAEKNVKMLIVLERSMRNHKAFCSCAQKIIHKVNHWHLFKDLYKECSRMSM